MERSLKTAKAGISQHTERVDWGGVLWYLLGTFLLSWAAWLGLYLLGIPGEARGDVAMYGPAVSCLLVRWLRREGFADAGLRLASRDQRGTWRWYLAAYLVPLLVLAVGLCLSLLLGWQRWILPDTMRQLHLSPAILAGILAALPMVVVGLVMIVTFGEELGWRGYLLPRLLPLGQTRAALLIGVIWGLWHIPTILLDDHGFGAALPWLSIPAWTVVITFYSIFLTWLRTGSSSIWPGVLAHAVLNTYTSFSFASFSVTNRYLGSPIGLVTMIPFALLDLWIIWRWLKCDTDASR
ncbi:abortive infection protein [Dictyobacter sp. S3.2.2.5]|uniref:Abortive infection protein n=1 Tax=Dictyobacter halimunensis TaxID=3026934 RepID=A0ABQ6G7A4_9CHLR|nr:abortive infection protein [Dictyobacter sp. S3.2.2.5]